MYSLKKQAQWPIDKKDFEIGFTMPYKDRTDDSVIRKLE